MKRLASHLTPYRPQLALALAAIVIGALTELGLPYFLAEVINNTLRSGDLSFILRTGGIMLALAVASIVCTLLTGFLAARISSGMGLSLRNQIFERVMDFSLADTDRFTTASLITRSTNDVTQIQNYVMMLIRMVLRAPVMAIGGVVMAYFKSPKLSALMLVSLPLLFLFVTGIARLAMPMSAAMQKRIDRVNLVMREKLTGIRVIRAFGNEQYEQQRFDGANSDLTRVSIKMQRTMSLMMPCASLVMNGTIIALVWFGGIEASYGGILVGDIMALVQYVTQILMSVMMLSMVFVMMPRAMVSADRVNEVLDATATICDPEHPVHPSERGCLVFENVCFSYPNAAEPAISDISFSARPGETTAIIGSTGSGKTTLLHLILRFYDVNAGRILVDGVDIRQLTQQDLRAKIGYVPQRAALFSGTIADNIRQGRPEADDAELAAAVALAQAQDLVDEREQGVGAPVAQGGVNLSGGQKQRLSIARAVVRRPEIYLFDDSFSALDFATDAKLRAALAKETRDATVLIVAQRVSTILHADRILVLDSGELVGMGSHRELMESCAVYREIVTSQLSQEEIDHDKR